MYAHKFYGRRNPSRSTVEEAVILRLRENLNAGNVKSAYGDWGRTFAADMLHRWNTGKRTFSTKQADWIQKLADAQAKPAQVVASNTVDVAGIVELFERAAKHLKFPKIVLQTASGETVVLSRAGNRSRTPGWINITDGGRFGENRWYGKINPASGVWELPKAGVSQGVQDVVFELSEDPAGVAARYGKITGNCSFCRKGLTDDRSLAEGYGPVCADKWGLPWGNKNREYYAASAMQPIPELPGEWGVQTVPSDDDARVRQNLAAGRCPDGCCGRDD